MRHAELLMALGCLVGLGTTSALADWVRPKLGTPAAMTRTQQAKLEEVASASLFGQFRSNMSDFLWLKVDKYLHSGVDLRGLTKEEKANLRVERAGHAEASAEGHRSHSAETTLVPSAKTDWRGILGDVERDIKPFRDMTAHEHRDPKETLPLFRLMTWSNPRFVMGYTTGAVMMARNPAGRKEALAFLEEGRQNNPESIEIESTYAFILMKGKTKDYAAAVQHAEQALRLAQQKDRTTLNEDELTAWEDAVRWQILAYRDSGKKAEAIQAAQAGLKHFPEDVTCIRLLKEEGLYNAN